MSFPKPVLIADSHKQFLEWCFVYSHHPSEYHFLKNKTEIERLDKFDMVQLIGNYVNHPYYEKLLFHCSLYGTKILKGEPVESYCTTSGPIQNVQGAICN